MTIKSNTAESSSALNGDAATGTTTGTAGDALSTGGSAGTRVFSTANPFRGNMCYLLTPSGVSGQVALNFTGFTGTDMMAATLRYRFEAMPTVSHNMLFLYTSANPAVRLLVTELGMPRLSDYAGTTLTTGVIAIVAGRYYLIQVAYKIGTSSTTGTIRGKITDSTTGEVILDYSSTTVNAGGSVGGLTAANGQFGKLTSTTEVYGIRLDDIIVSNEQSTLLPALVDAPAATVYADSVFANPGNWTVQGGAASIPAALRDGTDSTYAQAAGAVANESMTLKIGSLSPGDVRIKWRYGTSSGADSAKIELLEGTTVRATDTKTVSATITDYVTLLTSGQNAAIVDRSNLYIRITDV